MKKYARLLSLIFFTALILCSQYVIAQDLNDSLETKPAEVVTTATIPDSFFHFKTQKPNPKRAGLYSALLPGLGQVYNKQYWKTGVVALGAGVIGYFIISNRRDYLIYQKDYIYRIDNNPQTTTSFPDYQDEDINTLRKGFRKYYEYSILAGSVGYLINILDAFTSAHLKTFDMGKDISIKTTPFYQNSQIGLRFTYCIK